MIKKLLWESEMTGVQIADFKFEKLKNNRAEIEKYCINENIEFIQSCVDINDRDAILFLEKSGFHFEDIKLSMVMKLDKNIDINSYSYEIAAEEDIERVKDISKELFYYSRFNIFGEKASKMIYEVWAEKAVKGEFDDICLKVRENNGDISGIITIKHISEKEARIGIIAVELTNQKSGYGMKMMNGAKKYLLERGIEKFYVVTQGKNINAQKFYHKCGFVNEKIELWYYKDMR